MSDPFDVLYPPGIGALPVLWHGLRIPGPPPAFALTAAEGSGPPLARFARRIVQQFDCGNGDRLALVDKASPHARFDLMLSEVSCPDKATPDAVQPTTAETLWRMGLAFIRFVSDPAVQATFGLAGGRAQLALNCDPHTRDRESVQAGKQFHLHLLYWRADELAPLEHPGRLDQEPDPRLRRQTLDPLTFLGPRLLHEALGPLLAAAGHRWLPDDPAAVLAGRRPPGALLALPGWAALGTPAFAALLRALHLGISRIAADLLWAFTDQHQPPPPWQRHPLLPGTQIAARVAAQGWSGDARDGLGALARALRTLSPASAARLRRTSAAARMHTLTLNPPAYALTLQAEQRNTPARPLLDAERVLLAVQPRLFSGIGGAGLLALAPAGDGAALVPSVRVRRGVGTFSEEDWRQRADFQRAFALAADTPPSGVRPGPVRRLRDLGTGWA